MNMLDRAVLYVGVLLTVILAAVGISHVGDLKETLKQEILNIEKAKGGGGRLDTMTYDKGAIQISQDGNCSANPGAYYAVPANTTKLQWSTPDGPFKVTFATG